MAGPDYAAKNAGGIISHMQTPLTGIVAQHSLRVAVAEVMAVEDVTEGVPTAVSAILHRKLPQASSPTAPTVPLPGEAGFVPTGRGDAIRFRGQLTAPSDQAYDRLVQRYGAVGLYPAAAPGGQSVPHPHEKSWRCRVRLRRASQRLGGGPACSLR